jgi:glycosyltransferase involved in cell wall biosynthesis
MRERSDELQPGGDPAGATEARGSVIIPAHNEESSIGHCLSALLQTAQPGEFEVIVVCNGCSDGTAVVARGFGSMVRVIEIEVGSKIFALNLGNKAARFHPRLYLDADLELSTGSARALLAAAAEPSCFAAIGQMDTDATEAPWLLRQYYAVWNRQAYLRNGKFGGAYALSEPGWRHVGVLPPVINDDEYVRRLIPEDKLRVVPGCSFRAQMPRTLRDLLAVRTRVHRGNRQLTKLARASGQIKPGRTQPGSLRSLLATAWRRPDLWVGVIAYVAVNSISKLRAVVPSSAWGRDESSRRARMTGAA